MNRTPPRLLLLPWLILVAMLGATWLVWDHEHQRVRTELRAQFDFALRETVSRIDQRVAAYEQMLRGVQGLLTTTDLRDRKAIHNYVETLGLDANFAGIQAIGVVERVPSARRAAHVAAMRRLGFGDYAIHPAGERDSHAPVIQREPSIGRNLAPLGYDAWAEPVRRQAMEKARDSGIAAITGKVQLSVDKDAEPSPGFVMYLPVFAHGQPRDSIAQRREHLIGWVYVSFHMQDFMASLYGGNPTGLALAIHDDIMTTETALMYRNTEAGQPAPARRTGLSVKEYMVVAGRTWTLALATQPEFENRFGRESAFIIASAGIGLSLAMALLAWLMITGRARALQLAAEMTEELRHMAQHDALTGLPNRALFSEHVQRELAFARRHETRFAMIFLDLDNFKPINDNHGHAVGDQLLQQVAIRLHGSLRASDTVGRIGGDEFVVLVGELAEPGIARALAEKIRLEVRRPFHVEGLELAISCSLGVAVYPDDGGDEVALFKSADTAMYRAKESGRDSIRLAHE